SGIRPDPLVDRSLACGRAKRPGVRRAAAALSIPPAAPAAQIRRSTQPRTPLPNALGPSPPQVTQPRCGWAGDDPFPGVAPSSQPQALGRNPLGIQIVKSTDLTPLHRDRS